MAATTVVTGGTGGGVTVLKIDQFDATLGTLTGVTISYKLGSIFGFAVGNFSNSPATVTATLGDGTGTLKDANGTILVSGIVLGNTGSYTVAPPAADAHPGQPGGGSFVLDAIGLTGTLAELTDSASLAAFTGSGEYDFTIGATLGSSSVSGATYFGGQVSASDSLSVTYTYSPTSSDSAVPEPATWSLMISGFGAIGALARRRRSLEALA